MRLGFFTYGMDGERMTGIARYAVELTRALHALEPNLEIILLNPYPESQHPWYQEFETYPLPRLKLMPFAATLGNWQLHRAALDLKLDILHDPCGIAPFLVPSSRYRRVTTIHDAIPYIYPDTQPFLTRFVYQTLIRASPHTADAVVTVSQASRRDLIEHIRIPQQKLFTVPAGVTPPTTTSSKSSDRLRHLAIEAPYFLVVGALHPRKNLSRVVDAFNDLRQRNRGIQLAIVGPPSWGADEVFKSIKETAKNDSSVIFTGFVSDEDLDALYRGAVALVFPSLYEGFGLPALESMIRGTPVITSTVSSLPEVVGNAGILVDPHSKKEIASAMHQLLQDEDLRKRLSEEGVERAKTFTWKRAAKNMLEVYKQCAE